MVHALKIKPEYFNQILNGFKSYEIRKNDRDYKNDDFLALNEFKDNKYTGRFIIVRIIDISEYPEYLKEGYIVLELAPYRLDSCARYEARNGGKR